MPNDPSTLPESTLTLNDVIGECRRLQSQIALLTQELQLAEQIETGLRAECKRLATENRELRFRLKEASRLSTELLDVVTQGDRSPAVGRKWLELSSSLTLPTTKCEDGLTPDGPVCPRCGGPRGPSGVDGGSWVHTNKG